MKNEFKRLKSITTFFLLFLFLSLFSRSLLILTNLDSIKLNILNIFRIYLSGIFYDISAFSYIIFPLIFYLLIIPDRLYNSLINRYIMYFVFFIFTAANIFNIFTEFYFWEEFGVRYNFIAVDYLVYTTEVLNNIRESYPMHLIMIFVVSISIIMFKLLYKFILTEEKSKTRIMKRILLFVILSIIPLLFFYIVETPIPTISNNVYENNLAGNGIYCLFSAFRHNTLDYDEFYKTYDLATGFKTLKKYFCPDYNKKDNTEFSIERKIVSNNVEKQYNIILVVVESMSAEFLKSFGNNENLTPNLDKLAENGVIYTNLFATGTRTIRGLEAISLSIPPIPGQSILKRPHNENLDFCISKVLQEKNYDLKFIYGGLGYFDNMNYFFSNNGFKIIDRSDMKENEISFSNAWGVCDEDLFKKVIKEASESYKEHKKFFTMVMTTSNHRPFTYPENKIDIKSGAGRNGAVKYCDYAVGKLIESAKKYEWFDSTLFVFTADHCASSAGKVKIAIDKYRIPLIIYAPKFFQPHKVNYLASQIDIVPTVLDLLGWKYNSKFFGTAIGLNKNNEYRAFVSNYQKLGYLENDRLVILEPKKISSVYKVDFSNFDLSYVQEKNDIVLKAASYYQSANYL